MVFPVFFSKGKETATRVVAYLAYLLFSVFLCGESFAANSTAEVVKKTILFVNSYHKDFTWVDESNRAFEKSVEHPVMFDFFYLDYKRNPGSEALRKVEQVKELVNRKRPDLAVLSDDFAMKSLGQFLIDKDIPVVFFGINGHVRDYVDNVYKVTGVLERPLVKRSIVYLRDLMGPQLDRCLVLMDSSFSSKVFVRESLHNKISFNVGEIHADVRLVENFDDWKSLIRSAGTDGYDVVILGTYHFFHSGEKYISSKEVINWTSANSPIPLFGLWDFAVGDGMAVGGYILSGHDHGLEAAKLANRILNNEDIADIPPVIDKKGRLLFSKKELDRWGIILSPEFRKKAVLVRIIN